MKIRIADRILVALAGIVLLAVVVAVVGQVFFGAKIIDTAGVLGGLFAAEEGKLPVTVIVAAAVLLLIGVYCVCMLFRRRRGKKGFVLQQTENGELSIAIKAMEGLVHKCVECHPELKLTHTHVDPGKDGITVDLRIALASGVSIPLAVGALQKQIRQYITACSGVDVKEVRVQVETTSDQVAESPYAVPALLQNPPSLLREAEKPAEPAQVVTQTAAPAPVPAPVPVSPVVTAMPVVPAVPVMPEEPEEKDERPMHQRLFGIEEQPVTVPVPPVMEQAEEAPAEEIPAEETPAEEPLAEEVPAEETAPAEDTAVTEEAADEAE